MKQYYHQVKRITSWRLFFVIWVLIGFIFLFPYLQGRFLFNYAQLNRLKGSFIFDAYNNALKFTPNNKHIIWQTTIALAQYGYHDDASMLIKPVIQESSYSKQEALLIMETLARQEMFEEASQFYQNIEKKPSLHGPLAASIAFFTLRNSKPQKLSPELAQEVLTEVFGLHEKSSVLKKFKEKTQTEKFWSTQLGKQMLNTLKWKGNFPSCKRSYNFNLAPYLDNTQSINQDLLLSSGFFEQIITKEGFAEDWIPVFMTDGKTWKSGIFSVGITKGHAIEGNCSLRIDGLWLNQSSKPKSSARAGLWHSPINVPAETAYIVSFSYRTTGSPNKPQKLGVWFSNDSQVFFSGYRYFPKTRGQWKQETFIVQNNRKKESTIKPLIVFFGEGSVWIDNFSIYPSSE